MEPEYLIRPGSALQGRILDLGGGGEGILGRIYGQRVTAIDKSEEELNEAPDGCEKLRMDATALKFGPCEFDHVTAFYSMMYMTRAEQQIAMAEACRVLRAGGCLHLWDTAIHDGCSEPFTVRLAVDTSGTTVHTTYGVLKQDGQDSALFVRMGQELGLALTRAERNGTQFYLRFTKPTP